MSDLQTRFAEEAVRWADKKVPFVHQGETETGCDCTGLIIGILTKFGKLRNYKRIKYKYDWNLHAGACDIITEELLKIGEFTKEEKISGDILVFKFGKCNSHAGIFIKGNQFVHSVGSGITRCGFGILKNSPWAKRLTGVIRLNEEKISRI